MGRINVFQPFTLKNGPIYSLPDDMPGLAADRNSVRIESQADYDVVMRAMNCHEPEPGEKVAGQTYEGKVKKAAPITSVLKDTGF
jgi:hypothetical protein